MVEFKRYVLGFLFTDELDMVLMIKKQRPAWQAGLWNAPGGKANAGEDFAVAMRREFREETGVDIAEQNWRHVLTLHFMKRVGGVPADIAVFTVMDSPSFWAARTITDEPLTQTTVKAVLLERRVVENVPMLLLLCKQALKVYAGGR